MKKKTITIWSRISFGIFLLCLGVAVAFPVFGEETTKDFKWVVVLLFILMIASVVFSIVLKRIEAKQNRKGTKQ